MNKALRALLARKAKHVAEARALMDLAAKDSRDLTDDVERLNRRRLS